LFGSWSIYTRRQQPRCFYLPLSLFLFQFVDKPLVASGHRRFDRAQMHCCQPTVFGGAYSRCPKLVRFVDKGLSPGKTRSRPTPAAEIRGRPMRLSRRGLSGGASISPAPVDP
jgi:hypothetical protein